MHFRWKCTVIGLPPAYQWNLIEVLCKQIVTWLSYAHLSPQLRLAITSPWDLQGQQNRASLARDATAEQMEILLHQTVLENPNTNHPSLFKVEKKRYC